MPEFDEVDDEVLDDEQDEVTRVFDSADRTGSNLVEDDVVDDEPEVGGGDDGVSEGSPASPPPSNYVDWNGRQIPRDHAQNLVEFYDWARANPQAVAVFDAYLGGQMDLVPKGQKQEAPKEPEPDLEELIPDPVIRREFEDMRKWRQETEQQMSQLSTTHMQSQVEAANQAIMDGRKKFASEYSLSDDEADRLIDGLSASGMLPSFAQQAPSWTDAVYKGLETMYWATPEYREREMSRKLKIDRDAKTRQRKAAALSGSSGSVPRNRTPRGPDETRAAMVADIRAALEDQ